MTNPHAWNLSDLRSVKPNGVRVFTTFACGGGSSMGYKRAGCEVVAANDIDQEMAWHYKANLKPTHYFLCPIRDLLTADLPPELFGIDILDGSPPCSTFSMAGSREDAWGKEKHFREGQAKQVLSDLFFDFLDLAERIKPKVVIAENVKGMILGNAKGYSKLVCERLRSMGYRPQLFLLNAADCGVPQRRERVFFCAVREDVSAAKLDLKPSHVWVSAGEACSDCGESGDSSTNLEPAQATKWPSTKPGEDLGKGCKRLGGKGNHFTHIKCSPLVPFPTGTAKDQLLHWKYPRRLTFREWKRLGSFPDDYHAKTDKIGKYMIGMSVPPKMTEYVARQVCRTWLGVE
jgi:DNA (cytosine-5)-methyltransferase 1